MKRMIASVALVSQIALANAPSECTELLIPMDFGSFVAQAKHNTFLFSEPYFYLMGIWASGYEIRELSYYRRDTAFYESVPSDSTNKKNNALHGRYVRSGISALKELARYGRDFEDDVLINKINRFFDFLDKFFEYKESETILIRHARRGGFRSYSEFKTARKQYRRLLKNNRANLVSLMSSTFPEQAKVAIVNFPSLYQRLKIRQNYTSRNNYSVAWVILGTVYPLFVAPTYLTRQALRPYGALLRGLVKSKTYRNTGDFYYDDMSVDIALIRESNINPHFIDSTIVTKSLPPAKGADVPHHPVLVKSSVPDIKSIDLEALAKSFPEDHPAQIGVEIDANTIELVDHFSNIVTSFSHEKNALSIQLRKLKSQEETDIKAVGGNLDKHRKSILSISQHLIEINKAVSLTIENINQLFKFSTRLDESKKDYFVVTRLKNLSITRENIQQLQTQINILLEESDLLVDIIDGIRNQVIQKRISSHSIDLTKVPIQELLPENQSY